MRAKEKGKLGSESPKKWLRASRVRRAPKKLPIRSHKEQLGKGSFKIGICSQIENEEEEESWQEGDQMAAQ